MRCEYCNAEEAAVVIEECYHDGGTMGYSAVCHDCAARNLDEAAREHFEERAAIREFDGGLPRCDAERAAMEETILWLRQRRKSG